MSISVQPQGGTDGAVIFFSSEPYRLEFAFNYDRRLQNLIKGMRVSAQWDPERKSWHCPESRAEELQANLTHFGYRWTDLRRV